MDKKEIEHLIEQEKETLKRFQKFALRHKISEEVSRKQIDLYLDTLNKLYDLLKTIEDE